LRNLSNDLSAFVAEEKKSENQKDGSRRLMVIESLETPHLIIERAHRRSSKTHAMQIKREILFFFTSDFSQIIYNLKSKTFFLVASRSFSDISIDRRMNN
jgi:hypothetical protein